ncbi:DUF4358 domain-containing protein [Paenibacillus sp. 1001270B_150601_E10]|uniref:DUF4358 domain-containing protein n=1 Tax=Paenibacillus sp. 1001270B_150601_E10 TaxID=2787079 RepID=UPI0018A0B8F8|nr:DUF4358 domain-containing protein [Paenibacillus sp. 1001270B_150601_E10]
MKKLVLMMMAVTLIMVGCGTKKEAVNVPVTEIMNAIKEKAGYTQGFDEMNLKQDADMAGKLNIDPASIEEGLFLKSMINVRADEVMILKAADDSKIEELKKALEDEVANQDRIWSTYLPQEYAKVENHIIKQEGNYLILIIAEHPEELEQIFTSKLTAESK